MRNVQELFDLARQCYAQANATLYPIAKETLRAMGDQYMQQADRLRRAETIQAAYPKDRKLG